jgi:2-polyprenyl-6-methoxyphenol hydroxylase-like FAD-dependent oxidoreductase
MSQDSEKLNVAIVGGGVCGLTLAVALQKNGMKAHIYEAAVRILFLAFFGCSLHRP